MRRINWIAGLAGGAALTVLTVGISHRRGPVAAPQENVTAEAHRGPAPDTEAARIRQGYLIAGRCRFTLGAASTATGSGSAATPSTPTGGCTTAIPTPVLRAGPATRLHGRAGAGQRRSVLGLAGGQTFGAAFTSRNAHPRAGDRQPPRRPHPRPVAGLVLRTGVDLDHAHPSSGRGILAAAGDAPGRPSSHMTDREGTTPLRVRSPRARPHAVSRARWPRAPEAASISNSTKAR